jgi:hypothetical protein
VRQTRGNPIIGTEDFTTAEVKEIAALAMNRYRKISMLNYVKNPAKTLKKAFSQPGIVVKYFKDLVTG